MYVREKKIRRGEKTYSYWQVVQGARVEGKVRQTVIAHLGTLPDGCETREDADLYARARGFLCSAIGCGQAGVMERMGYAGFSNEGNRLRFCESHAEALKQEEGVKAMPLLYL